ncbi:MAG TPA: hypothetical protein VN950_17960 [Terriglobales bacterium]|jgi:hypothetical protein|nr:hypothetical protein [Terriglobales bacterium]
MQDAIGIGILVGVALLFRMCFHSTTLLSIQRHDVARVVPFNIIAFWMLLLIAAIWTLLVGFVYVARLR